MSQMLGLSVDQLSHHSVTTQACLSPWHLCKKSLALARYISYVTDARSISRSIISSLSYNPGIYVKNP